jgi:hypothetical protein
MGGRIEKIQGMPDNEVQHKGVTMGVFQALLDF